MKIMKQIVVDLCEALTIFVMVMIDPLGLIQKKRK